MRNLKYAITLIALLFAPHVNAVPINSTCSNSGQAISTMPYINFFLDGSNAVTTTDGAFAFQKGIVTKVLALIQDLHITNPGYPSNPCPVSYVSVFQGANFNGDFETKKNASTFSYSTVLDVGVFGDTQPVTRFYYSDNNNMQSLISKVNGIIPYTGNPAPHSGFLWALQTIANNSNTLAHPTPQQVPGVAATSAMVIILTPGLFDSESEINQAINYDENNLCGNLAPWPPGPLGTVDFESFLVLFEVGTTANPAQNRNFMSKCFSTQNTYNTLSDYSDTAQTAAANEIFNAIVALGNKH